MISDDRIKRLQEEIELINEQLDAFEKRKIW